MENFFYTTPFLDKAAIPRVHLPYIVTPQGVTRLSADRSEEITLQPVWLIARGQLDDIAYALIAAEQPQERGYLMCWVPLDVLHDPRKFVQLSKHGYLFDTRNAVKAMTYLTTTLAVNDRSGSLYSYQLTRRQGWHGDSFVLGAQVIPPNPKLVPIPSDERIKALHPSGQLPYAIDPEWRAAAERVRAVGSWARFVLAATLAPILLPLVGARTFGLHLCGDTRAGKTAVLKLGLAAYGEKDALFGTMNTTENALYDKAVLLNHLPFIIDETTVTHGMDLRSAIYALCHGQERARSAREGGLKPQRSWMNMLFLTGETSVIPAEDTGGIATRILEIVVDEKVPAELGRLIHERVTTLHYGSVAPVMIKACAEIGRERLTEAWQKIEEALRPIVAGACEQYAGYAALVALADYLLSMHVFGLADTDASSSSFRTAADVLSRSISAAVVVPLEERALEILRDLIQEHPGRFQAGFTDKGGRANQNQLGFEHGLGIAFFRDAIDHELRIRKLDPKSVWKAMKRRNWLICHGRELVFKSGNSRFYLIQKDVWSAELSSSMGGPATDDHSGPPETELTTANAPASAPKETALPEAPKLAPVETALPEAPKLAPVETALPEAPKVCRICGKTAERCDEPDAHREQCESRDDDWLIAPAHPNYSKFSEPRVS